VRYPTASASALHFQVVERDVFHAVLPKKHPLRRDANGDAGGAGEEPLIDYASTKVPVCMRW
jgi:hypothetical protein